MSYEEFRKRIDTMCDILVGAVPSPAGQIDQITYALMYKFMNDIDEQAAAMGGKRKYFTGDYEKYNWHRLMEPGLEAHERLELYRQAIQTMSKNPGLPPIFRDIYERAFLPFNSAGVLTLFLKEIDKFSHGHSDDIGDVYEYLLSRTGAQGEVGQFRTPRHIIQFIVDAVNPTKTDSVLDPACGTAGFLIAAYNHVRAQHDGVDAEGNPNGEKRLTSDDKDKLHSSYHGFDIDPTMVRTASVNMYLHNFTKPDIRNHDTLSSEDFWDDKYDVILANPPFMTPKGGIQPHRKFSVKANRAEVLFVDYIASHLKPTGRAGIIVPEGIIFSGGNAYKQLRKSLIENSLYAVVSLPSGVFNPYAGVKTSILLLDKKLAKERDDILFVNIDNVGVTLDAKQSKKSGSQLPSALEDISLYKNNEKPGSSLSHLVKKEDIINSGDYNLTGSRYIDVGSSYSSDYPVIELSEIITESKDRVKNQELPVWSVSNKHGFIDPEQHFSKQVASDDKSNYKMVRPSYFAYNPSRINVGSLALNNTKDTGCVSPMYVVFSIDESKILESYLMSLLESDIFSSFVQDMAQGAVRAQLRFQDLARFKIPLPPLEIQREIVAELDGYQTIIDSAQKIISTYKPTIKINPEWETVKLGDKNIFDIQSGGTPSSKEPKFWNGDINWATLVDLPVDDFITDIAETKRKITHEGERNSSAKVLPIGTVIVSTRATIGRVGVARAELATNQGFKNIVITDTTKAIPEFVALSATNLKQKMEALASGGTFAEISKTSFETLEIPLPPLETQRKIVAELEAEQQLITANKTLIEIYQQKIKSKLTEVWGE